MDHRTRLFAAAGATVCLFVLVQLGALALAAPFVEAGFQAVEDPSDPTNSLLYIGAILVATAFMLAAFRWNLQWLVRGTIILVSALLSWYVFVVLVPPVVTVAGFNVLALLGAIAIAIGLLVHPEWYVIDAAGIVMGAGAAALFGISFGLLPALVLLIVLAVYDAISVYGTEHMLSLAEGVMDIKLPVILVIPVTLSYSFLAESSPDDDGDDPASAAGDEQDGEVPVDDRGNGLDEVQGGKTNDDPADGQDDDRSGRTDADADDGLDDAGFERDALFIGLGDAVIPAVLVVSAAVFAPAESLSIPGVVVNLPAVTAMIGIVLGLIVLLWMVLQGRPHAGLPLLNGGAIAGYLVGALASGLSLLEALGLAPYF